MPDYVAHETYCFRACRSRRSKHIMSPHGISHFLRRCNSYPHYRESQFNYELESVVSHISSLITNFNRFKIVSGQSTFKSIIGIGLNLAMSMNYCMNLIIALTAWLYIMERNCGTANGNCMVVLYSCYQRCWISVCSLNLICDHILNDEYE